MPGFMVSYSHRENLVRKEVRKMYEVIEIATRNSMGIFGSARDAMNWANAHGGLALFLITPW